MTDISLLTQNHAEEIASWDFPSDYQWTLLGHGSENEYYLLREHLRGKRYFQLMEDDKLLGYFSVNNVLNPSLAAMQIVLLPSLAEDAETALLQEIFAWVSSHYPDVQMIRLLALSTQLKAQKIYASLGCHTDGPLASYGHDMSAYEQEGFTVDENGRPVPEIQLYIYTKAIR